MKKRINIMIDEESLKKIDQLCFDLRISRSYAISKLIMVADFEKLKENKKMSSH